MARIPKSLQLTPEQIDAIMLRESRLRISTLDRDMRINLTPMTFAWAGGKVYIFGRGKKVANLRQNSTATILVDIGEKWRDLKGIMMHGHAQVLEDEEEERADEHLVAAQRNLGEKHKLSRDGVAASYIATAVGRSRRWLVFTPETTISWNNENLP